MKADIFFVIASAAVVIVSVVIAVAAVYLIRILRDARDISAMLKEESSRIIQDVEKLRAEGAGLFRALRIFGKKNSGTRRKEKRRSAHESQNN